MSMIVYKYEVGSGFFHLDLPADAQVLTVQAQDNIVVMWVLLKPQSPLVKRSFICVSTGTEFEAPSCVYIGTVQVSAYLVKHVFEIPS